MIDKLIADDVKKKIVRDLTSFFLHKHYCENDDEALIAYFEAPFSWFGAAEHEYAADLETTANTFRQFAGKVPLCNISDEHYDVLLVAPDVFLCTGRLWIATDPSTNIYLRVHQRITALFRWTETGFRCHHIHISNPYSEMVESDIGFPTKFSRETYTYLQEQIDSQKKNIEHQTNILRRMSFEDSLTGLCNRNKFNQILDSWQDEHSSPLGLACFDLNGLKKMNDRLGHSAGDNLLRQAADYLRQAFGEAAFRIGGDEFVIIDDTHDEAGFRSLVLSVHRDMELHGISSSVGISWRASACNIRKQFDEADRRMYEEKKKFYLIRGNDRRK